jgi:hypothetical protein
VRAQRYEVTRGPEPRPARVRVDTEGDGNATVWQSPAAVIDGPWLHVKAEDGGWVSFPVQSVRWAEWTSARAVV